MRTVILEEHVSFPEMAARIPAGVPGGSFFASLPPDAKQRIAEVDGERLKSMDKNGITLQVLSVVGPGAGLLDPKEGSSLYR
jgi:uncharacterized protein